MGCAPGNSPSSTGEHRLLHATCYMLPSYMIDSDNFSLPHSPACPPLLWTFFAALMHLDQSGEFWLPLSPLTAWPTRVAPGYVSTSHLPARMFPGPTCSPNDRKGEKLPTQRRRTKEGDHQIINRRCVRR
uniref:Uncharacterized protein n=1 Tax=Coccidioides posadasii RMSCC 3488 TaxID=454284 RepID=A0A0J6F3N4_COCPO|nr:hypothetical protein CPAG_03855 [Coccidioides posadasii RMSCC 3488]